MKRKACYAVKKGYKPGLYFSWDECLEQVSGFRGASYKKFSKKEDAQKYLDGEFDDSDLFLTQEETSNLSINNIELIEYIKKDKNEPQKTK